MDTLVKFCSGVGVIQTCKTATLTPCSDPTFSRTLAALYSHLTYSLAFSVGYCEKRMRNQSFLFLLQSSFGGRYNCRSTIALYTLRHLCLR